MTKDFDKGPEVAEFTGAVIWSFYKDISMFVFRANGAGPTMSRVAFMMLLSTVARMFRCLCSEQAGQSQKCHV